MAVIERNDGCVWTGDEWLNPNVVIGAKDAARWECLADAADELAAHADEPEFDGAKIVPTAVPDEILAAVMDVHRLRDSEDVDDETAERIFRGLYRRPPDDQDYEEGLWSHCLAWLADASEQVAGIED
jgi:hypothetical protein